MSLDVALDIGSASARLVERDGPLYDEPCIAAVDADSGRLLAFGREALDSGASAAGRVRLVRPIRRGQIADLPLAEQVVAEVLRRAGVPRRARPRAIVGVHVDVTAVQRRALSRALSQAGAREVSFIELPIAVAVGAGLAIDEPSGSMVVEVGAGTADMAVLALGGMVTSATVGRGGEDFEGAVRMLLLRRHGLVVDQATCAEVLRMIGTVDPAASEARVEVLGRDRQSGRPGSTVLRRSELRRALDEAIEPILAAAARCIGDAPPDLANDLLGAGLVLAGGASALDGLPGRLALATGLRVNEASAPRHCAVNGAAQCFDIDAELPALELSPRP